MGEITRTIPTRDPMGQRLADVSIDGVSTVADFIGSAVRELRLPTETQRGLPCDWQVRTADGQLLRPSESLADDRVVELLEQGETMIVPRLTAADA